MKRLIVVLISTAFVFHSILSEAQKEPSKVDLVVGVSIPEMYHIGSRFHYQENRRIDLKLGTNFYPNKTYYSATLGHGWHFGKESRKTQLKTWSFNTAYTLSFRNNTHREGYASYASLFFAREFALAKRLFLQPELGASILVFDRTRIKDGLDEGYNIPVIPKIGMNFIYKL